MLLPHLYKVLSSSKIEEGKYEFIVEINPEDSLFKGHFPGRPILPGVCTILIVKECICSVLGKDLHFMNIAQCKFIGMVDPNIDNKLVITISIKTENSDETVVNASINNSNSVVFKIRATLTEASYGK